MKYKVLLLSIAFSLFATESYGQPSMLPVDSLYLDAIENFYEFAEDHKEQIWPGMELSPVVFYRINGPAFLYNHPDPPETFTKISVNLYRGSQSELQLFGDTITEINGTLSAIVNYARDNFGGVDEVTATLFHELHHAWQRNEFPHLSPGNPATGLTYPEIVENDALKIYEQKLLYKLSFSEDEHEFRELLNRFYTSRLKRDEIIGDYTDYEKAIENFEGPAYYNEYKFFQLYSNRSESVKKNYFHKNFWSPLATPHYGRQNLRLRHLASGFAMCYLLDKYHTNWKTEYYTSGLGLFDFFVSKFEPEPAGLPDLAEEYALSSLHTNNQIAERKAELTRFYKQPGTKIILDFQSTPQFRGFDPVNTFAIDDDTILHKNSLRLEGGENQLFIEGREIVTIVKEQVFFVEQAILFVPDGAIDLQDDKIVIQDDGVNIRWTGNVSERNENLIRLSAD